CEDSVDTRFVSKIDNELFELNKSPGSKDYAAYLLSIRYFYKKSYNTPLEIYKTLAENAKSPWLKETAQYMIARSAIILAQEDWDGYSDPPIIDEQYLSEAETAAADYLKDYSDGLYAGSAEGFKRRIAYLKGDHERLEELLKVSIHNQLEIAS